MGFHVVPRCREHSVGSPGCQMQSTRHFRGLSVPEPAAVGPWVPSGTAAVPVSHYQYKYRKATNFSAGWNAAWVV